MKFTAPVVAALLLCAAWSTAHAQEEEKSRPSLMGSNAEGFHFMVGFMQNEMWEELDWCRWDSAYQSISISSKYGADVTVIMPDGTVIDRTVRAFEVLELEVDPRYECIGEGIFPYGIEIRSTRPITVSCYSSKFQTSDGYLALPISSWGTDYVSANYWVDHYTPRGTGDFCSYFPRGGEFAIIAAHDATLVTVTPSTKTLAGVAAGAAYRRVLRRGEIFQVQDGGTERRSDWALGSDITGSVITADKPVGVLSGHVRSGVTTLYDSKDHLIEMLPPRNALGRRYLTIPFGGRQGGDLLRVISTTAVPTTVTVRSATGGVTTLTMASVGSFIEYDIFDPVEIVADQPVLVTQYSRSAGSDPRNRGLVDPVIPFDPDMVVLTPQEQFVNGAIFATPGDTNARSRYIQFNRHFVTVVGERNGFESITLNGTPLTSIAGAQRGDLPNTNYVWATVEIAQKSTHVLSGDCLFAGYLYGLGKYDSYAWPIGSGLRRVSQLDDDPPAMMSRPVCGGAEVIVIDSGMTQNGLQRVWIDTVLSSNATFIPGPLTLGDEMFVGIVRPIDAFQVAYARIWAVDRSGHLTYLDVTVTPSSPTFSSSELAMGYVQAGELYSKLFTISNNSASTVRIDTIYLVNGRDYYLDRTYRNMALAAEGGQLTLKVSLMVRATRSHYDTLVIVADCREYRIPLSALAASPEISTNGHDFGRVRVGRSGGPAKIVVVNTGDADLVVDSVQFEGATFSRSGELRWPVTIRPGEDTVAMEVLFQPTATATFTGVVRFFSNVPDSVALAPLIGRGIYPTLTILGYDFGRVQLDDTVCTLIPVVNIGSDTAFLTGLSLPNPESFSYDRSVFPHALPAGDTLWVSVCFSPSEERTYVTDVSPRNDDDLTAMNSLRGIGYRLRATLGGKDMGRWWIGEYTDSTVYVTNVGTDPITITRVWIAGGDESDFALVEPFEGERTLAAGARLPILVRFSPLQPGPREVQIHAETGSRFQPQLDSVLTGFGLHALSSDTLEFDDTLAYSCGERSGRLIIRNDGNVPLTIDGEIRFVSDPPVMTMNVPAPGHTIAVGESLPIDFTLAFAGHAGVTRGTIAWSFKEPPNQSPPREFTRELVIESMPQRYVASATAPAQVVPGETFELAVTVDSAAWPFLQEQEVSAIIEFDPSMTVFDDAAWSGGGDMTGPWRRGAVRRMSPGKMEVTFTSATGKPLPLLGMPLPTIPFKSYIGERERDSLRVRLTAVGNTCAMPALAGAAISLDSICGLSVRLFEFTGEAFALRQNRPNPVHDRTDILFTLGMEASTRLELFAPDGRLVRVLIDEPLAAGDYTIAVDVTDIASGQYYYRLTSGPFSAIRQMQISQ